MKYFGCYHMTLLGPFRFRPDNEQVDVYSVICKNSKSKTRKELIAM